MRHAYFLVLSIFTAFVLLINLISFATSLDKRQLVNLFHLSNRAHSIVLLLKHIVFESGVMLKNEEADKIAAYISDASKVNNVDPLLVSTIVTVLNRKTYSIDFNGAVGYMAIQNEFLNPSAKIDPYMAKNNISIGTAQLAKVLQNNNELEPAILQYLTSHDAYNKSKQSAIQNLSRDICESYFQLLAYKNTTKLIK